MSDSTHDTSWDIEKYRCEYEPTNHWNLRKKFMELHKDKYPEGRLVSLAQLFINITCLGCRLVFYYYISDFQSLFVTIMKFEIL